MIHREQKEVTYTTNAVTGGNCDFCGEAFKFVFPDHDPKSHQFEGVMHIHLSSGYGESPFLDGIVDVQLCTPCTKQFLAAFPKIKDMVENYNGLIY